MDLPSGGGADTEKDSRPPCATSTLSTSPRFPRKLNCSGAGKHWFAPIAGSFPYGRRMLNARWIALVLCLSLLASLPGCGGCSCRKRPKTPDEMDRDKAELERRLRLEREKQKPPLEVSSLISLPHAGKAKACWFKPGHWTSATLAAKANHDDILADLSQALDQL